MASIEKRGPNSYRLIAETGYDANGKRMKKTKTIKASTKREAQKELAKFVTEVEAGEYIAPEKMTFSTFTAEWEEKYAKKHLGKSTLNTYKHHLNNHILPIFGHIRLDQIKPIQIATFIEEMAREGSRKDGKEGSLSPSTIRYIHRVLKDIFSRSVEWRIIKQNPVSAIKRPKLTQKEIHVYNEEEATQLFTALEKEAIHWRIMITLALTTGMRRGELLGLEWENIDLEHGTIEVRQSLSYVNGENIVKEPKNKSSLRKVSIPSTLLPDIKEYSLHCRKDKLKTGNLWEGGDHFFVFSSWNGKPLYHTTPGTWFRRFIKKHNLKSIRFHDLRHTSATLLINQGVHAKIISERLGHADIRTTMNIYGHALQTADQAAANKFDSLLINKTI